MAECIEGPSFLVPRFSNSWPLRTPRPDPEPRIPTEKEDWDEEFHRLTGLRPVDDPR